MLVFTLSLFTIAILCGVLLLRPIAGSSLRRAAQAPEGAASPKHPGRPSVSVVIPARNEERSLPALLASLQVQTIAVDEVIVVDDQSEDGTATIARDHGATVITPSTRPESWLGKPWAVQTGAAAAGGDVLLFLDADVRLEPDALAVLLSAFKRLGAEGRHDPVISVQPYHTTRRWYERLALLFNIQIFVGAARRVRGLTLSLSGSCCYGPCILCSRSAYEAIGGHESVRSCVLEDIELGNRFRRAGVPVHGFSGRGAVQFRMYPDGVGSMINGFSKNLLLGALRANPLFFFLDVFWMCGLISAPVLAALYLSAGMSSEAAVSLVAYMLLAAQVVYAGSRLGSFGTITALLHPLPVLAFLIVVLRVAILSATGRQVVWKGRKVSPGTREDIRAQHRASVRERQ